MVLYDDKIFQLAPYAFSATSELIVGFLIFCIPSFPKFFKETPVLKKLFGRLRSGLGLPSTKPTANSRQGLPSWIRVQGQRQGHKQLDDTNDTELDSRYFKSISTKSQSISGVTDTEKDTGALVKDVRQPPQAVLPYGFITVHDV